MESDFARYNNDDSVVWWLAAELRICEFEFESQLGQVTHLAVHPPLVMADKWEPGETQGR